MMKIPPNLSMRLEKADRVHIQKLVTHYRKHGPKGRSATVSDALRWAWAALVEVLAENNSPVSEVTEPQTNGVQS